jgi:ABC-2 type transport system ATP-binding protein
MAQTAEHLIVVGRGRLIADTSVQEFIARSSGNRVRVRTTDPSSLTATLQRHDPTVTVAPVDGGALEVTGLTTDEIGMAASRDGITLLELTLQQTSLEEAFMALTADSVEYHGSTTSEGHRALQNTGADR